MSSLVAMIVLAYLLVIAVCVALWTAVSLRRTPVPDSATKPRTKPSRSDTEPQPRDRGRAASARSDSHDAYRGARARTRSAPATSAAPAPATSSAPDRARPSTEVPLFTTDRDALPSAPRRAPMPLDADGAEFRPDVIRVTESKRIRERSAHHGSDESRKDRNTPEDAFERFLRANEDFER